MSVLANYETISGIIEDMTDSSARYVQVWTLVGNSDASEAVWNVKKINFPCGYATPCNLISTGNSVVVDCKDYEHDILCGLAFEIGRFDRQDDILPSIKWRPWVAAWHNYLETELKARNHTYTTWDNGVGIFYGLWKEGSQCFGPILDLDNPVMPKNIRINYGENKLEISSDGYVSQAQQIITFFSEFLTLNEGDLISLGPLINFPYSATENSLEYIADTTVLNFNIT